MSDEKEEDQVKIETAQTEAVVPAEIATNSEVWFELSEPLWSVVTFENCAAKNLTYEEALNKMKDLKEQNVSGLCIVTDEAAERIQKK